MSSPAFQSAFHVSGSSLVQSAESDEAIFDDPRGLVLMWEPPLSWATYILGIDPTVGITGWNRGSRRDGDTRTDNGAIEIFRVDALKLLCTDRNGQPEINPQTKQQKFVYRDLQVAEYAAPIDATEIAQVANILGRVYAGREDQCQLIHEAFPGPGLLTTQELLRLGYGNIWMWEYIDSVAEETNRMGWRSSFQTKKLLSIRSRMHLMKRRAKIQSPFLLTEIADATMDPATMVAESTASDHHGDRLMAANLCFWAGHKWTYDPERSQEPVTEKPMADAQNYAPVIGETRSYRDAWADMVDSWT